MDSKLINQSARGVLAGTQSFPEVVKNLLHAGVEYYHVDYATLRMTYYGDASAPVTTAITFAGLPEIARDFSADALKAAILDSQRNGQHFQDFSRRAMAAGVQGYFAFLRGQGVTYFGRQGEQHTEWFPGAAPAKP